MEPSHLAAAGLVTAAIICIGIAAFLVIRPNKQITGTTMMWGEPLDAPSAPNPPLAARYFSKMDKERVAEALFRLSELTDKRVMRMCEKVERLWVTWENQWDKLDQDALLQLSADLTAQEKEAHELRKALWDEWISEFPSYSDRLRPLLVVNPDSQPNPFTKLAEASSHLSGMIRLYANLTMRFQLDHEARNAIRYMIAPTKDELNMANANTVGWVMKSRSLRDAEYQALAN
jgi:hypothetical protein